MAKLSISQAARAYGKDRKTISRHINEGKLSCEVNTQGHKLIDIAELVRAYGEPKQNASPAPMRYDASLPQHDTPDASPFLKEKITLLERQINELCKDKDEYRNEKEKLLGIIERQTLMLEDKREKSPIQPTSEQPETHKDKAKSQKSQPGFWTLFVGGIAITIIITALSS